MNPFNLIVDFRSFGADGVLALADALRDENPAIAQNAANVLASLGRAAAPAAPALIQALDRPEAYVRTSAILALAAIGPENAPAIERLTTDPDSYTRATALSALRRLQSSPPSR